MNARSRFTLLILAGLLALASRPVMAGVSPVPGDANGDGKASLVDALLVLRAVIGQPLGGPALQTANADLAPVNPGNSHGDNKLTVSDVMAILRLVVGIDSPSRYAQKEDSGAAGPPEVLPSVQFNVALPRGTFGTGDSIPFTLTVRNNTDKDFTWTSPDSCQVDLQVTDESGKLVWHPTAACLEATSTTTLKPGETQEWKLVWDGEPWRSDVPPRRPGVYTARAELKGTDYRSSTNFQVSDASDPVPLPHDGPATFDLTPGRGFHYVNLTRGGDDEVIRFLSYVKQGDQIYTAVSRVPDAATDVLMRLDADGDLVQRTGDIESVRLRLNAKEGETWTFEYGSKAAVKLVSRNASLKTPGGIYGDLLQFEFFVGPDNAWTEWVHPSGFWVGYTRDTIAGPVEFRLGNRDAIGIPISPDQDYSAVLYPGYAELKPGEKVQFSLIVADKTGAILKELPGPVRWAADEAIGTIDQNGLFTAVEKPTLDGIKGTVTASVVQLQENITARAAVVVGTNPVPPPPIEPPVPPVPPTPAPGLVIDPQYARIRPGGTFQFTVRYLNEAGQEVKPDQVRWSVDPELGTIDEHGILTARADVKTGVWGAVTASAVVEGDMVFETQTKVYVGTEPVDDPVPNTPPDDPVTSAYRMSIEPRYAFPNPGDTVQFQAKLIDSQGNPVNATFQWYVEDWEQIGTVTETGLFTAGPNKGAGGPVYVKAIVDGKEVMTDYAKVEVGGQPLPPPPPVDPPTPPDFSMVIEPRYAYPQPGETVQFKAQLLDRDGKAVNATYQWYIEAGNNVGTVTPDGLFTAGPEKGLWGPVHVKAIVDGQSVLDDYAKVAVGLEPVPLPTPVDPVPVPTEPVPEPGERLAYLEGGSLKVSIPPTLQPEPLIQADISGLMPDPSWSYDRTEVQVTDAVIQLKPILKQTQTGPVPAVTVPFSTTVMVHGLESGKTYTVVALGADTKLTATITL